MEYQNLQNVDIVIPAFNAETTIAETLGSVLNQTYDRLRIVVVNDGSTDGTSAVVNDIIESDNRIELLDKENGGPASARNFGIRATSSDYIAIIDADDIWHPRKIELQLQALESAGEGFAFIYSPCRLIDGSSKVFRTLPIFNVHGHSMFQLCYYNFTQNGSSILFRRSAFEQIGGFNESIEVIGREDQLFALELASKFKVTCLPNYLIGYRFIGNSLSQNTIKMYRAHTVAIKLLVSKNPSIPTKIRSWSSNSIKIRCVWQCISERRNWIFAFRLFTEVLVSDPKVISYSFGRVFDRLKLLKSEKIAESTPFYEYSLEDVYGDKLPDFIQKKLEYLRTLDEKRIVGSAVN